MLLTARKDGPYSWADQRRGKSPSSTSPQPGSEYAELEAQAEAEAEAAASKEWRLGGGSVKAGIDPSTYLSRVVYFDWVVGYGHHSMAVDVAATDALWLALEPNAYHNGSIGPTVDGGESESESESMPQPQPLRPGKGMWEAAEAAGYNGPLNSVDINRYFLYDENRRGVDLTLPAPGAAGSLSANAIIATHRGGVRPPPPPLPPAPSAPYVLNVSSTTPSHTVCGAGEEVVITVTFSAPVAVYCAGGHVEEWDHTASSTSTASTSSASTSTASTRTSTRSGSATGSASSHTSKGHHPYDTGCPRLALDMGHGDGVAGVDRDGAPLRGDGGGAAGWTEEPTRATSTKATSHTHGGRGGSTQAHTHTHAYTHRHAHTPGGGAAGGVGSAGRRAVYIGGNLTDTLSFAYTVSVGDMADPLDYLDTRPAAKTQRFSRALEVPEGGAAITAVGYGPPQTPPPTPPPSSSPFSAPASAPAPRPSSSPAGLLDAKLALSVAPVVHAVVFLPLPGVPGSLAANTKLTIDTNGGSTLRNR